MEKVPTMRFTAQEHLKAAAMVPDRELKDLLRTTARLAHQSAAPKVPGTLPTAKASSPFPRQPARDQLAQLGHPLKNALQGRVSLMGGTPAPKFGSRREGWRHTAGSGGSEPHPLSHGRDLVGALQDGRLAGWQTWGCPDFPLHSGD